MAVKRSYEGPATALASYADLVATIAPVDRKGATTPYTSCNGHMFSFLDPAGSMALRLPADAVVEFVAKYQSSIVEQHGRVMKEYVVVPDWLLESTIELQAWFERSYRYVNSLRPKPTK